MPVKRDIFRWLKDDRVHVTKVIFQFFCQFRKLVWSLTWLMLCHMCRQFSHMVLELWIAHSWAPRKTWTLGEQQSRLLWKMLENLCQKTCQSPVMKFKTVRAQISAWNFSQIYRFILFALDKQKLLWSLLMNYGLAPACTIHFIPLDTVLLPCARYAFLSFQVITWKACGYVIQISPLALKFMFIPSHTLSLLTI